MDQNLFINTANGTLGLNGTAVIDTANDPGLFTMRSTGTGPISFGDKVTLGIGLQHLEVDPATSRLQAVPSFHVVPQFPTNPVQPLPGQQLPGQGLGHGHVPPPTPVPVKSTSTFILEPVPGSAPAAFAAGTEFELLSDYGCLRCRNGFVEARGAVDTDAPARLRAKFA